jgi:hypothetical protein
MAKSKEDIVVAKRIKAKEYYWKNKDAILAKRKELYSLKKEEHLEKQRAYREKTKDKQKEYNDKYRQTNAASIKKSQKKHRDTHKTQRTASFKQWYEKNKHKNAEYNAKRQRWIPVVNGVKIRKWYFHSKEDALRYPSATEAVRVRKK